jgi:hypothetical protein
MAYAIQMFSREASMVILNDFPAYKIPNCCRLELRHVTLHVLTT